MSVIAPVPATRARRQTRTRPRRRSRSPERAIRAALTVIAVIVVGFPVYYTLLGSLLPARELASGSLLPRSLTLDNFRTALSEVPLGREYLISVLVTALQTAAEVLTSALAAYALVFTRWRGQRVVFAFIVATLAIPGDALVIPNYVTVTGLGLTNTVLGITLPYLAAGYTVFLLRQAFLGFPREVWEAAMIDGCGHLRCLLRVVLPMTSQAVATAAMWSALAAWNGYFWPLLITDEASARTIQVGLGQLANSELAAPGVLLAGVTLVLLPTLLLVIAGQRFLQAGLARGMPR
jgi:ABC-type glycerol-3-phosphate transport system permease component